MDGSLNIVPLYAAEDDAVFGGKAAGLCAALRAGLPVPAGFALSAAFVRRVAAHDADAVAMLQSYPLDAARLAVRSSAAGEDSSGASFAGQHATLLNVPRVQLPSAVRTVWASAHAESALAYRVRRGLPPEPQVGVVVQALVEPMAAGVLFTRNPLNQADELVVEASWGLGEAVVSGAVTPDHYRLRRDGDLIDFTAGHKDVKISYDQGDGTTEVSVPAELHAAPCLQMSHLDALRHLAQRCEGVYGPNLDIEWAVSADQMVYLLQCRPITTAGSHGR